MNKCKTPIIDVKDYKDLGILPLLRKSLPSLIIFSKLGEGAYGAVYDVIYENKHAALKIETTTNETIDMVLGRWCNEIYCHQKLEKQGLCPSLYYYKIFYRLIGFRKILNFIKVTIMEKIETTVNSLIVKAIADKNEKEAEQIYLDYVTQVLFYIEQLHKNSICHLDIKSDNIAIFMQEGKLEYRLIDTGLSRVCDITSPLQFMADYIIFFQDIMYHQLKYNLPLKDQYINFLNEILKLQNKTIILQSIPIITQMMKINTFDEAVKFRNSTFYTILNQTENKNLYKILDIGSPSLQLTDITYVYERFKKLME